VLEQIEVTQQTRALLGRVLAPAWFRSDAVLSHARAFFPEEDATSFPALEAQPLHASIVDYLGYVLLDFAMVDEALGEVALAHTWTVAEAVGFADVFEKIARDELKMTKRGFEDFRKQIPSLLERAQTQLAEPAP